MEFRVNHPVLFLIAGLVILLVLIQSVFFLVRALRRARELGMDKQKLRKIIISVSIFTVAPAISILVGVLALAKNFGVALPWLRLSVIGSITYETVAAGNAMEAAGMNMSTTVTDPSTIQKPEPAEKPDWDKPTEPPMPAASKTLADMVRKGSLKERKPSDYPCKTSFETSLTRPISIDNKKIIVFYDADGKTVLDRQTVEYGARFTYNGRDISRWEDDACKYTFAYWTLADGTNPELIATDDLSLYAKYWTEKRFYTVTWVLDGRTERQTYAYGTMPTCPFVTNPAPDAGYT